ncbi:metallo-peptidase, Clan MA(E) Family M3,putative [Trypanosoma brucei gambiense DAL972]|uniref:Thimet oligopeptidase A, putative n=1 Tax=Trypanosoma brucei gambiense (strain MHOM/CI/86/DAL972) TaxID=679716 RepID=C9ZRP1_TRYB9|nr:metallo-peptidase, Clan MA(E) Family M3,putative [Trypanosoma brucei gambiense DAL972]CBH12027.1 metallo-peptidase, Clan MA(E) Family M3,putative [Trypanosoma brucei gambiense DAL972]|eukprot:XP_011774310.1 metallo-peptidase, Clan MA(E) Family M3,putative [Trypanosoma brucei gambiense DAL972]
MCSCLVSSWGLLIGSFLSLVSCFILLLTYQLVPTTFWRASVRLYYFVPKNSTHLSKGLMTSRLFADIVDASKCAKFFPKTPSAVQEVAAEAKRRALEKLERIYSLSSASRTFLNTASVADVAAAEIGVSASLLSVAMNVSPDEATRQEAKQQMVDLQSFSIDHFESNKRLFESLKAVSQSNAYRDEYVNGGRDREYSYWLDEELKGYKRKGMELPDSELEKVVSLQKELSSLCTTFSRNISEDKSEIVVSAEELAGVPENGISGLSKTKDGLFVLKMDYPTLFSVMKNCEVASTRREMSRAASNKAYPENLSVLREIVTKRQKLAELLKFSSFSELNLDDKMVKSPEAARAFIDDLVPRLQEKWKSELELILRNLHSSCALTEDGRLRDYDVPFMINQVKKSKFNVSETDLQEYFPLDTTVKGLFDIYERFFDVTFTRVDNGDELWHKDAFTLHVLNNKTKDTLGHVVLDLFPREGKFSHACCISVVPPVLLEGSESKFSPALSVVLANFPAPSAERPSLFLHDDVVTFFHEFGHAIHSLFGRSKMATFAGTRVKRDFVELPSQMLEEWVWEVDILRNISCHYKTKEKLPTELVESKVNTRNTFSGRDSLRQLEFASYSLELFSAPFARVKDIKEMDTSGLMADIRSRINPHIKYDDETHFECSFGHLTGYGAGYYGYMWSKVFALDVYDFIKNNGGLLNPAVGERYVSEIIGVGGGKDPSEMLRSFLGREPRSDAFFKSLGA